MYNKNLILFLINVINNNILRSNKVLFYVIYLYIIGIQIMRIDNI